MEAEARYTYVGAAVLALLLALVIALVWLTNIGGRADFNRYVIYFENQQLDGLQVGADVNVRGIKVGRVEDYALSARKLNRVRVELRVNRRVPVLTNTVAVITRNFVTGIATVNLVNPAPPGAPLTVIPDDDHLPVIAEGRSDLTELTGRVSQVGDLASTTLTSLNQLLSDDNRRDVMDTVRSLRDLSVGLQKRLATVDRALERTGLAATSIAATARRLGDAGERVTGVVEQTGQRLGSTLAQGEQTLAELRSAVGRAAAAVDAIERQTASTAGRLEATAMQFDDQSSVATNELRLSMEATTRMLDGLRDPRAALLGPGRRQLGPGEVKP